MLMPGAAPRDVGRSRSGGDKVTMPPHGDAAVERKDRPGPFGLVRGDNPPSCLLKQLKIMLSATSIESGGGGVRLTSVRGNLRLSTLSLIF